MLGFATSTITKNYYHIFYRLNEPTDLGLEEPISYVVVIIGPTNVVSNFNNDIKKFTKSQKMNKSVSEVTRSFANAFQDPRLQHDLLQSTKSEDIQSSISSFLDRSLSTETQIQFPKEGQVIPDRVGPIMFGSLINDIKKRIPIYWSDWKEGAHSSPAITRSLATVFFLYFACILPAIAFGAHNEHNTLGEVSMYSVFFYLRYR